MEIDLATKIAGHPKYQELKAKRTSFGWWLTLAGMVSYYGFILLVAFNKPLLAQQDRRRRHDAGHAARRGGHRLHHHHHLDLRPAREQRVRLTDRANRQGSAEMSFDNQTVKVLAKVLAVCAGHGRRRGRLRGRRRSRPGHQAGHQLDGDRHVRRLRRGHAVHHQVGGGQDQERGRLLHRRRRHHRLPERPGDRRRLHVGGLVPGHLGPGVRQRLRRPDLLDRLAGRLARHHLPDGRAAAQPGQVHLCRRRRLPLQPDADPRLRGQRLAGRRGLLPDRADGRCGPAHQAAVRHGLPVSP